MSFLFFFTNILFFYFVLLKGKSTRIDFGNEDLMIRRVERTIREKKISYSTHRARNWSLSKIKINYEFSLEFEEIIDT